MYDIMHLPQVIELGKTGENDFTKLEFDLRPWLQVLPEGVASIVHIRPGETSADSYIATTTFEDGILTWIPNNADLGTVEGYGQMEIWLEEEVASPGTNKRGKSVKIQTFVQAGIGAGEADPPEPQESWIEQMTELKTATVNAKDAAVLAQTGAETAEGNAEAWAVGQRDGTDVGSSDPTYHNNSKYYSQQSAGSATAASGSATDAASAKQDAVSAKTAAEAAKDAAQAAVMHYPYVDPTTGDWMVWDGTQGAFVDTGIHAKGDTGEVPDIAIGTVTTLQPDQSAYVTRRSGSPDTAPIFDFGIPKGETGQAGNVYGSTIDMSTTDATKVATAVNAKASKVTGATSGNFAALDSNGDLTDSGHKHSDYLTSHQDISGKADKVASAVSGNVATLDSNGNLVDGGHPLSDYLPTANVYNGNDKTASGYALDARQAPIIASSIDDIRKGTAFRAKLSNGDWILNSGEDAAIGDYIWVNGYLGKATAAITGGSTAIVENTNWEKCAADGALNELVGGLASANTAIGNLKGSYDVGSNTLANIQDAIYALVDDMENGEQKNITFTISTAASPFSASTYIGELIRLSRTRFRVEVGDAAYGTSEIFGRYKDGTWYWGIAALKSDVTVEHLSTGVNGVDAWRFGKTMVVNISDIVPASFTNGEIWTVPSGYRPGATFRSVARVASAGSTARLAIGTSNYKLSIIGATDQNAAYYGQITWIINS